jgi:hypothetical protein
MPGVLREGFQGNSKFRRVCNETTKECFNTCGNKIDHEGCKDDEICDNLTNRGVHRNTLVCKKLNCAPGEIIRKHKCVPENSCEKNGDCKKGLECYLKKCVPPLKEGECRTPNDCKHRFTCENGKCVPINLTRGECFSDSDCQGIIGNPFCRIIIQGRQGRCSNSRS